jgi:hypothetical protein
VNRNRFSKYFLHYDSEPEVDDYLEVISAIGEKDARTLLYTECSTYVLSEDYVIGMESEGYQCQKHTQST